VDSGAGVSRHRPRGGVHDQDRCGKGRQQQLAGPIKAAQIGGQGLQLREEGCGAVGVRGAQPRSPPDSLPRRHHARHCRRSQHSAWLRRQVGPGGQKPPHRRGPSHPRAATRCSRASPRPSGVELGAAAAAACLCGRSRQTTAAQAQDPQPCPGSDGPPERPGSASSGPGSARAACDGRRK